MPWRLMRNTMAPVAVAPAVGVTLNFSVRSVWSLSLATTTVTFVPSILLEPTESGVISGAQLASGVPCLGRMVISYVPAFSESCAEVDYTTHPDF